MGDERDLPGIPRRHGIPRPERKQTVKVAVPPPGAGNKEPPKRSYSPAPIEDPQPTSAQYGEKVVELGETQESLEAERQRRHEAEAEANRLRSALRVAESKNASTRHVEASPKVESSDVVIIERGGIRIPWRLIVAVAPWVVGAGSAGALIKSMADKAAPTPDAPVIADYSGEVSKLRTELASLKTEQAIDRKHCRAVSGFTFDVLEQGGHIRLRDRPDWLGKAQKLDIVAPNKRGVPLTLSQDIEIVDALPEPGEP